MLARALALILAAVANWSSFSPAQRRSRSPSSLHRQRHPAARHETARVGRRQGRRTSHCPVRRASKVDHRPERPLARRPRARQSRRALRNDDRRRKRHHSQKHPRRRRLALRRPVEHAIRVKRRRGRPRGCRRQRQPQPPLLHRPALGSERCRTSAAKQMARRFARRRRQLLRRRILFRQRTSEASRRAGGARQFELRRHQRGGLDEPQHVGGGTRDRRALRRVDESQQQLRRRRRRPLRRHGQIARAPTRSAASSGIRAKATPPARGDYDAFLRSSSATGAPPGARAIFLSSSYSSPRSATGKANGPTSVPRKWPSPAARRTSPPSSPPTSATSPTSIPRTNAPSASASHWPARAVAYGEEVEYRGPELVDAKFHGGAATLTFDRVGQGLKAKGTLRWASPLQAAITNSPTPTP